jgi:hypothetical protein
MNAKVVITTLNEFSEEVEKEIINFNSPETAQDFMDEHEQDFHDDPEIYAVYIK